MSESTDRDRLEVIIDYLKQNSAALSTLDRRMDSLGTDVKIVCESMKSVVERQAELERDSANRMGHCSEIMDALKGRLSALERLMTPIPEPFDPSIFDDETSGLGAVRDAHAGNGADKRVSIQIVDGSEEVAARSEDDTEE